MCGASAASGWRPACASAPRAFPTPVPPVPCAFPTLQAAHPNSHQVRRNHGQTPWIWVRSLVAPESGEPPVHRFVTCTASLAHTRHDGAMDPAIEIRALGGAARWGDLVMRGVSEHAITTALRRGVVVRAGRGVYALRDARPEVVAARAFRGQVACVSACSWWGFKMLGSPSSPHVSVPRDRSNSRPGARDLDSVELHRTASCDLTELVEQPLVAIDRAALCTTPLEQLVIVDSALRSGLVDRRELDWLATGSVKRRQWLRANAHPGADSVGETVARVALTAAGLKPVVQARRDDVGRVDLEVAGRVVVEVDGYEAHSRFKAFTEDRRRDRTVAVSGGTTLRFTYWDVVEEIHSLVDQVSRVVGRHPSARFLARMAWMTDPAP